MISSIRISLYLVLIMATIVINASAQRLSGSATHKAPPTTIKPSNHHHNDAALDVDEMILMNMEKEWGMREMGRYKNMRGSWPLRSELPGYTNNIEGNKSEITSFGGHSRAAIMEAIEDEDYFGTSLIITLLNALPKLNIWCNSRPMP